MWIVIERCNRYDIKPHNVLLFTDEKNAQKYVSDQMVMRIRQDIDKIGFKNGKITYQDGTEIWYDCWKGDIQDE